MCALISMGFSEATWFDTYMKFVNLNLDEATRSISAPSWEGC